MSFGELRNRESRFQSLPHVTGGTFIYCKGRYTLASHGGGPWWRCGWCGQLVKLVDNG